jgi:peptide/nickel transport system permease protein
VILYIAKRVGLAALVIVVVMVILAVLVNLVPGNPARIILGTHATPQLIAEVQRNMGLDNPIRVQVWDFVWQALHGNLGTDFLSQEPVSSEIGIPLANTAILSLASVLLAIVIGVPLGIVAAVRQGGVIDGLIRGMSMILLSTPVYVVGLLLLLFLAVDVHAFPALGAGSFSDPASYLERLVLPALALAAAWWAYLARLVRASMLEVLDQPFVRAARAYGLRERVIEFRVVLKNALVPVMALFGMMLGYVLAGTVYVETIFGRVGLGNLSVSAVGNRDWPLVRACVLIYAAGFILGNLLADVAYRFLDPRMRLEASDEVFI